MQESLYELYFPKYIHITRIISLFVALLFKVEIFLLFLFFLLFQLDIYTLKFFLMKKINNASDSKDERKFKILHRFSVIIFILQLLIMVSVYYLLTNQ